MDRENTEQVIQAFVGFINGIDTIICVVKCTQLIKHMQYSIKQN